MVKRTFLFLLMISSVIFKPDFILAQTNLTPFSGNPVLEHELSITWENIGVFDPFVLFDGNNYRMWYTGCCGTPGSQAIGYATSPDGINWTKYSGNPVLIGIPGEWDLHINSVSVVYVGGQFIIYYSGSVNGSAPSRIGRATSTDGINWVKDPGNPIFINGPPASWDEELVRRPSVLYDGNIYHMWYEGKRFGEAFRIGYTTSVDGINWQKNGNNPVIDLLPFTASGPTVVWDGSQYVMFLVSNIWSPFGLGVAFSDDGENWQLNPSNPALLLAEQPTALFIGNKYKVWYHTGSLTINLAEGPIDPFIPFFQQASFNLPFRMSLGVIRSAYVPAQHSIYILGGYEDPSGFTDKIIKVDLNLQQTDILPTQLPFTPIELTRVQVAYNSNDGNIYFFNSFDAYIFDPQTENISLVGSNISPEQVIYGISKYASNQNAIYSFGNRGSGGGNFTLNYDPASNTVVQLTNTMQPGNNTSPAAAYCQSRDAIYLFGGNHSSFSFDIIQKFDPVSEIFTTLPITLPIITGAPAAVNVPDENAIYIFGGYDNSNNLANVYKFDCTEETLQVISDLPIALNSMGVEYVPSENRIYVLGGTTARTGGYSPATDAIYYLQLEDSNSPPIANAGPDTTICTSSSSTQVTLNSSLSSDPDNDPLTYTWSENGFIIAGPTSDPISMVALSLGSHEIELTVDDGNGEKATDTVVAIINPIPTVTFNPIGPFFVYEPSIDLFSSVSPAGGSFSGPGITGNNFDPATAGVGTHLITYSFTDTNGCSANAEQDITVNLPLLPHTFTFLADKKIKIHGQTSSEGDMHANDKIHFHKGKKNNSSTHVGKLTAVKDIKIDKDNIIEGDATAGRKVDLKGNTIVTGTVTENAAIAVEALPSLSFSAGGDKVTVKKNESKSLASGSYGKIKVKKNGTLELSSGDYFFKELDLKENTTLAIDVSAGPVTVNTVKKLHFHKNSEVSIHSPFGSASRFVTFNSLHHVDIHKGAKVLGSIIAPDDKVHLHKNVSFQGSICAKDIDIDKNGTLLSHNSSATLPKSVVPILASEIEISEKQGEELASVPSEFQLNQNYPNPFNPTTTIAFALPQSDAVTLKIYNLSGQVVRTLANGQFPAGHHSFVWDATNDHGLRVASGMYLYVLKAGQHMDKKKLLLMK